MPKLEITNVKSNIKEKNGRWKGNSACYTAFHNWLKYYFGKANKCELCFAKNKRFEWALKKDKTYEHKRENYLMLCPSCHKKYDYTQERRHKISLANKKRKGMKYVKHN